MCYNTAIYVVIQMVTLLTEGGGHTNADTRWQGGLGVIQMLTFSDRGGRGVKNGLQYADVIIAWSLDRLAPTTFLHHNMPIFFNISKDFS